MEIVEGGGDVASELRVTMKKKIGVTLGSAGADAGEMAKGLDGIL